MKSAVLQWGQRSKILRDLCYCFTQCSGRNEWGRNEQSLRQNHLFSVCFKGSERNADQDTISAGNATTVKLDKIIYGIASRLGFALLFFFHLCFVVVVLLLLLLLPFLLLLPLILLLCIFFFSFQFIFLHLQLDQSQNSKGTCTRKTQCVYWQKIWTSPPSNTVIY